MKEKQQRLYLLDLARAFAAICVVLQHYQHFYRSKNQDFDRSAQPFFEVIGFGYNFGSQAVPFFFMLSGFIFFTFYYQKICDGKINLKNFIILRLTRLYPLHFLTLIIVVFLQQLYFFFENNYFIWDADNITTFVSHIFLIQEWPMIRSNLEHGFNAPAFSISIELFLYISFFFISLNYAKNLSQVGTIIIASIISYCVIRSSLALGVLLFYYGGFIFYFLTKIKKIINKNKNLVILLLLILDLIIFSGSVNNFFLTIQLELNPVTGGRLMILLYFIKFPLIIINLMLVQMFFKNMGKNFQILGDMSYTIYLIHFPLQIPFEIINKNFLKINYNDNLVFLLYFFLVILFSFITYKFFELPSKIIIRKKLIIKN
jgi:peptidoglycan/LPS O-acetylase OafA/YrhL